MKTYRVRWEIDVEADSPEGATKRALAIQRNNDPENAATVFDVKLSSDGCWQVVDLSDAEEPPETDAAIRKRHQGFRSRWGFSPCRCKFCVKETDDEIRERHALEAAHNEGLSGMPQGPCQCEVCQRAADKEDLRRHGVEHHEEN